MSACSSSGKQAPQLRDYQAEAVSEIRKAYRDGFGCPLLVASTGAGKCLAAGTPVLMFDGSIKKVEDVNANDLVMGPDSNPRRVSGVSRGREMMYRVTPTKGDPYTVNKSHILSLKITGMKGRVKAGDGRMYSAGDVVNICVDDYMASSSTFKHVAKGWRAAVESFGVPINENFLIPPYILGVWLGDGTSRHPEICNVDHEVVKEWRSYAESIGHEFVVLEEHRVPIYRINRPAGSIIGRGHSNNKVRNALKEMNLLQNKHIPHAYKTASKENRLQLLAGIIDTDGYLSNGSYDMVFKQPDPARNHT